MGVVASASDILELDRQSIAELMLVAKQRRRVSTANPKTTGPLLSNPLVPGND